MAVNSQDGEQQQPGPSLGESAQIYSDLNTDMVATDKPGPAQLSAAAEPVLKLIETNRAILNKDKGLKPIRNIASLAELNDEVKTYYLEPGAVADPLVKEIAGLCQGAYFDLETKSRIEVFQELDQSSRDYKSFKSEKTLKLLAAKYLDSLRETVKKYPDLQPEQLQDWLARSSGDADYAKGRIAGLATEVATEQALLDMPEIVSIRQGTPEEDVMGGDLILLVSGKPREVWIDLKSSKPKNAAPETRFCDVKNSKLRVWLPSDMIKGFKWTDPAGIRDFYRDSVFPLI